MNDLRKLILTEALHVYVAVEKLQHATPGETTLNKLKINELRKWLTEETAT